MNDQASKSFHPCSALVSVKVKIEEYELPVPYYWCKNENSSFVFGNENDSSLTCWRDSETADVNCYYVFGVKASASDESYQFIKPDSHCENLHWSEPKKLPLGNKFSLDDNRIFFREKVIQDQNWKFKHMKSEKYVHIIGDQIVLRDSKETAPETTVTKQ